MTCWFSGERAGLGRPDGLHRWPQDPTHGRPSSPPINLFIFHCGGDTEVNVIVSKSLSPSRVLRYFLIQPTLSSVPSPYLVCACVFYVPQSQHPNGLVDRYLSQWHCTSRTQVDGSIKTKSFSFTRDASEVCLHHRELNQHSVLVLPEEWNCTVLRELDACALAFASALCSWIY